MPKIVLNPPLVPRDGRVLQVLELDRISTLNQDPRSNDDQSARNHRWVEDRFDGEVKWTRITGQGSGECLTREAVKRADELVETRRFDLVIMEDLGRHLRRIQAIALCELCEDTGTRLVAINDGIDTAGDWKLHAFFAAIRHEQYNKDTSQRIKRTLRNRFLQGGALERRIFGYIDPPDGAKTDADRQKDPAAEPIYAEWFRQLEDGASYADVADWLNTCGICGRLYRCGGHGQDDHLLCAGAHAYRCWNAVTVDGPKAALKISDAVIREISSLQDFDPAFMERLEVEVRGRHNRSAALICEIDRDLARNERHTQNIKASLREYGPSPVLLDELRKLVPD